MYEYKKTNKYLSHKDYLIKGSILNRINSAIMFIDGADKRYTKALNDHTISPDKYSIVEIEDAKEFIRYTAKILELTARDILTFTDGETNEQSDQ